VSDGGWNACRDWLERALVDGWLCVVADDAHTEASCVSADILATRADRLRDHDRVLAAFICQQRATELDPDDPRKWHDLGELAHIVGRRDDARIAYERYLQRHPGDAEIEHILIALGDAAPPSRVPDRCVEQLYARFAPFYDRNMSEELDYRAPALLKDAVETVSDCGRELEVLDLGCGTGLSGQALRSLARRLTGVDLSPAMIDRARARTVYDVLAVAEITAFLRETDTPFELIAACDSLIYFGDLREVLGAAAARLTPFGTLAFTVESGDVYPFALTDSGRFAHHRNHVVDVAADLGLAIASLDEAVLRFEYGYPVQGLVAVLRR